MSAFTIDAASSKSDHSESLPMPHVSTCHHPFGEDEKRKKNPTDVERMCA